MAKKLTIDFVRQQFLLRGAKLLSSEYINNSTPLYFECTNCGKPYFITWINFKAGKNMKMLCPECSDAPVHSSSTLEEISEEFTKVGAKLISDSFTNNSSYLEFLCSKCGKVGKIQYRAFKAGNNPELLCSDCAKGRMASIVRNQVDKNLLATIRGEFESKGAILKSKRYINNRTKLQFLCSRCHKEATITWHDYKAGSNPSLLCRQCLNGQLFNPFNAASSRSNLDKVWLKCIKEFYNIQYLDGYSSHHIYPYATYPEYRFSIFNGYPLPKNLHTGMYSFFHREYASLNPENWPHSAKLPFHNYKEFRFINLNSGFISTVISDEDNPLKIKEEFNKIGVEYFPLFIDELLLKEKREIIFSMFKYRVSKKYRDIYKYTNTTFCKIYARKCSIKEVGFSVAKEFLDSNHIQGFFPAKVYLGLFYKDDLVSVMTFGTPRAKQRRCEYELLRFANRRDTLVIGAASKLFNYFISTYTPSTIISYCDRRFSSLNWEDTIYPKLGFTYVESTAPNYRYLDPQTNITYNRIHFQKHKLPNLLENFDPNLSETKNMLNNGFKKIFDCGNYVFIWHSCNIDIV